MQRFVGWARRDPAALVVLVFVVVALVGFILFVFSGADLHGAPVSEMIGTSVP